MSDGYYIKVYWQFPFVFGLVLGALFGWLVTG